MAIWSRRNFIRISTLATVAAAVPVAAAKAGGKVVTGHIREIMIDGRVYAVQKAVDLERVFGKGSAPAMIGAALFGKKDDA